MKKVLIGSLVALATAGGSAAMAADMPLKAPPVPVFSWTGCYVGVEGGYAWGHSRDRAPGWGGFTPALPSPTPFGGLGGGGGIFVGGTDLTDNFNVNGGIAGVEYGCNQQFGTNWVFGLESDWSWSNKKGSANEIFPGNPAFVDSTKERWVSTSRMRVGWTWDRAWIYVTGGFAAARVDLTVDGTAAGIVDPRITTFLQDRKTVFGWTAGVGFEYMFWNNWSFKAEHLYMNFGENHYLDPAPFLFASRNFTLDDHIVRVGLNWRFTECAFTWFGTCGAAPAPIYTK
jgi:outer membrane immunogenic protein